MTTIRLLDARRGLNLKCRELFSDEKVAETIYRYLCDGIDECEDAEPQRIRGRWKGYNADKPDWKRTDGSPAFLICSECGAIVANNFVAKRNYCCSCGADMRGEQDDKNNG